MAGIAGTSLTDAVMGMPKNSAPQKAWLKFIANAPMTREDVRWVERSWNDVLTILKHNTGIYV